VTTAGLSIELGHERRLCYAMQQSAVPWLGTLRLVNAGSEERTDLRVTIELRPDFAAMHTLHLAAVPGGGTLEVPAPDLALNGSVLANTLERTRADLVVQVHRGDEVLATTQGPVDVLAYNEWPGLAVMPALLAAFVQPNHPGIASLAGEVAAELQQRTGSSALDGYQRGDAARVRTMLAAAFDVLARRGIVYVTPPPSFEQHGQKVRTPEQVLGERLGTCLDLALLYAALLEHIGLQPLVAIEQGHAFVGCWLQPGSTPEVEVGSAVELRKRCDLGVLAFVECTALCSSGARRFDAAVAEARRRLAADADFLVAIDVGAARRIGMHPLPPRTGSYAAAPPPDGVPASQPPAPAPPPAPSPVAEATADAPAVETPKDRLEHWKSKLLDLTLWNRLLNTVATKKTIPLHAPDLAALEDRLQAGGRFRVHARPALGAAGQDPRDLDLAAQRTGADVRTTYLAEELRAGRLRADLDQDELDTRLVEIFRHARTSLEESGANTLYLALGFLQWFESPQSEKARRAPLLLVPLTIERLSVQEGFRLVLDDGEPRVNQSLIAMLLRDHGLHVALGETPPEDEQGVDVGAVLDAFRAATLAMPRWEVQPTAWIGFFSFTKYLMWLDLAARDELLRSPVLRHLIERPGATFVQDVPEVPRDELDDLDPGEVFCPKDADSSQLAAVVAGAEGRTFVLEGPPGTGKSQTITNLIAQALANGKRVLFVAEKRAALEVVQRRLDEVGIGAFCLELHSSKSGPKAVLAQLRRALDQGARQPPQQWQQVADQLQQQRELLNDFVRALHRPREHGWSVFGAMTQLVELRGAPRLELPDLRAAKPAALAAARAAVERLAATAAALGVPDQEPWWGVQLGDWTPALARDVVPLAERLAAAADSMAAALAAIAPAFGLGPAFGDEGPGETQIELLLRLCDRCTAPSLPPPALLLADWRDLAPRLADTVAAGERRERAWARLADRWRPELLALQLDGLLATYRDAAPSFFLRRWWLLRTPKRELRAVAVHGRLAAAAAVRDDLELAVQVQNEDRALRAQAAVARALGAHWRDGRPDWAAVSAWVTWVEDVRTILMQVVPGALQPDAGALAATAAQLEGLLAGAASLPPRIAALRAAHDELVAARRAAVQRLLLDEVAAFGAPSRPAHCRQVAARARGWLAAVPRLRDHCAYRRAAIGAGDAGARPLVEAHATGALPTAHVVPCWRRTTLEDWLDSVHAAEPRLARFRGPDHERAIAQFAELDRRAIRLAAEVVVARLCAQLPQVRDTQVASSELGTLERELKKQRRHKPVRRLLAEIPDLFPRLAPCVLMSPLSVAQFLGRAGTRFDLVVFDEASQIPMWDAASAIGRGDSLVVVGDSRQLPPTTFFQRLAQGDEPAPDDLPEDLESVLDECGAAGLPRLHLDWHYRSRHESLITFSNHHYYHNRLLTFPAPHGATEGLGVRCVVVDGVYDRAGSQTNRIEAEQLVAAVVARLRDPERAGRSVGIVTFSRAQQVLIEDLLDRERALHGEIEAAFADASEPLFVKNLENVQGDERDAIYFSICYGADAAGKVYENYGPLNMQGGERRLNVAVTRARRELIVFTSVRPEQVANRTTAQGARHLRTFLDYALRGQAALTAAVEADPSGDVDSPFEAAVRDALVRRGHEVHTQVGCSGYRIDLAVVDPAAPGRYLLGIECDGAAYHSAATARDRDRLRAAVLEGLGWRLHRVWSTDFWQDAAGEVERIEAAIAAAAAALPPLVAPVADPSPPEPEATVPVADEPAASEPAADPDGPRVYDLASLAAAGPADDFAAASATPALQAQVHALLAAEAPITFANLARRIAEAWQVSRVTERVRERVREVLPGGVVVVDEVIWFGEVDAASFRGFRVPHDGAASVRAADDLPIVEVANAMQWLLRQHAALGEHDLAREAARCFGIQRLGSVVRDVMARALEHLVESGRGRRDGEMVRLP
jgi:very-short-patch-repair endonuclease